MVRNRMSYFNLVTRISALIGALIVISTPLYWIWSKVEGSELIDSSFVFRFSLSILYILFLYIIYNELTSRGLGYEEEPI